MPFLIHVRNALSPTGISSKVVFDGRGKPELGEADKRRVLADHPLKPGEEALSLAELCKRYPPPQQAGAAFVAIVRAA